MSNLEKIFPSDSIRPIPHKNKKGCHIKPLQKTNRSLPKGIERFAVFVYINLPNNTNIKAREGSVICHIPSPDFSFYVLISHLLLTIFPPSPLRQKHRLLQNLHKRLYLLIRTRIGIDAIILTDRLKHILHIWFRNQIHVTLNTDWGSSETLEFWREQWAGMCNAKFEEKGLDVRIDHRSYERQGIELLPTVHEGPTVRAMEKKGIKTEKGEFNRWIRATNAFIRNLRKNLSIESFMAHFVYYLHHFL